MSETTKAIKYAAPYRSATFNDAQNKIIGINGVLTGGKVTTSGPVVSVQPLVFVQNGLITKTDYTMTATLPSGLTAPYSIAVTVTSSVEVIAEVLVPTFVKRPQDVSSNTVIIADFDGAEWIARPKLEIDERILSEQNRSVTQDQIGITSGYDVSYSLSNVVVSGGSLVDRQGYLYTKKSSTTFPVVAQDADGFDRIDEIIYRKPDDDINRSGVLKYIVGQSFSPNSAVTVVGAGSRGDIASVNKVGKILVDSSNDNLILYTKDYGNRAELTLDKTDEQNNPIVVTTPLIATDYTYFDAVYNAADDIIDYVYVRGNNLFYARTDTLGVSVHAETQIATHVVPLHNPKIVHIKSGATYFLHIIYEVEVSGLDHQLYYVRLSTSNTIETAQLPIVQLSNIITSPSLAKDDDDSMLYLAFENTSTGKVYLRTYDASTATALAIPTQYGSSVELQDNSYQVSTNTPLPTSGASKPIVVRTDSKDTFVFFRQNKGAGYAVVVYNEHYITDFAYKSLVIDLTASSEDINSFKVVVDGMNVAHFIAHIVGDGINKASHKLEELTELGTGTQIDPASSVNELALALTNKGCLIHGWSIDSVGTVLNSTAPSDIYFFGPGVVDGNSIAATELVIEDFTGNITNPGYTEIPLAPTTGDTIDITSGPNAGVYNWVGVRSITILGTPYSVVETSGSFTTAGPVTADEAVFYKKTPVEYEVAKTNSGIFSNLRSFDVLRTDVFLAHYRASDSVLAVSGTVPEESTPVSRLYEFVNCFSGGGGVSSWGVVGANKLAFSGAFYVRFFNRMATYTIAAQPAGITILANQIAYVTLPDEDESQALTITVKNFGAGVLDRYGKNVYPLFWNIGGDLYTRFTPFKVSTGSTVVIGSTEVESKVVAVASGVTFHTVTLDTPRTVADYPVICHFTNVTDPYASFQPITITAQSLTQFTASWNAPTDSANYKLTYLVKGP